ncbi:MAG: DUF5362 family protein, partial [Flavobacteriaceae bacterium]|nr:DUF5362 family protein [Flavobacteriaceae bacterium]
LNETRKWTSFLAIMGFIFIALMIVLGFFIGSVFSALGEEQAEMPFMGTIIGFIYLVMGLIYFFPILYLYKFSTFTKKALENQNTTDLNEAFKMLKAHFRYMGILTIVLIAIYGLAFVIGLMVGFAGLMG